MENLPAFPDAFAAYFQAKTLIFQDVPAFRLLNVPPLICLHRHPGWPEVDAFYAFDVSAADAVAAIKAYHPQASHMITVFTSLPERVKEKYREFSYKPISFAQPFMVKSLRNAEAVPLNANIHARQIKAVTEYWIEREGQPVCWGKSVLTAGRGLYIYGMETRPDFRRQKLATALLAHMHAQGATGGADYSFLCSSPEGQLLYQSMDYVSLARMQAFVPED